MHTITATSRPGAPTRHDAFTGNRAIVRRVPAYAFTIAPMTHAAHPPQPPLPLSHPYCFFGPAGWRESGGGRATRFR